MTPDRSTWSAFLLLALAELPAQVPDTNEAPRLLEQLQAARTAGDQQAASSALQRLCTLPPYNPAFLLALAETHASLGPEFEPRRTAELCERFLALTDPSKPQEALAPEPILASLNALGIRRPADGIRSLRQQAQSMLEQYRGANPERLLLWPDRTALARKVTVLGSEHERITRDQATARRSLAAAKARVADAEADYARARRAAKGNQFTDTTELWTRVLDRREEVKTIQRRCDRFARELEQNRAELERHRARFRTFEAPPRKD